MVEWLIEWLTHENSVFFVPEWISVLDQVG